jgi:2-polyprenyl-6-methoxyphenol hydroxylase-like FAD-dependent oxidoreductase
MHATGSHGTHWRIDRPHCAQAKASTFASRRVVLVGDAAHAIVRSKCI